MPLLRYENSRSTGRRRLRLKLLAILLLLGVIKLFQVTVGGRLWNTATAHFWQDQCLRHELPEDRIAYLAGPTDLAMPPYLVDFTASSRSTWTGSIGALPCPVELAELQKRTARPGIPWKSGPVFMHGLRDSQGQQCMVEVYALASNPQGWWTLVALVCDPAGLGGVEGSPTVSTACWPLPKTVSDTLIVFAGQADRKDPSRFTIRVRLNGQDQLIAGVLRDDQTVDFISSTGLSPWSTPKAGQIVLPPPPPPEFGNDNVLLPTD